MRGFLRVSTFLLDLRDAEGTRNSDSRVGAPRAPQLPDREAVWGRPTSLGS